ncbi:hypothetical protein PROFUN_14862 [Planoprotostelium fungivorum]|uniref:Uncharacterized protein n=1 Tax=Planoprotostelium fungivorum TaxID=1890364 RepID=A0A2P6MYP0_9EUKA|nr:hypothetical protein PROFUN_14862 [Planoprotostelium fungivorum]
MQPPPKKSDDDDFPDVKQQPLHIAKREIPSPLRPKRHHSPPEGDFMMRQRLPISEGEAQAAHRMLTVTRQTIPRTTLYKMERRDGERENPLYWLIFGLIMLFTLFAFKKVIIVINSMF